MKEATHTSVLRDFTVDSRVLLLCVIAAVIGCVGAIVAYFLLQCIALATNLFYFGRLIPASVSPARNHLGWLAIFIPALGGLVVGLMARFGSDRIRGHGIPEAIESILLHGARVQPRLAILKPISAAIAIGSGGPFGAEGPIIMTGGAFGSIIAQFFQLTDAERTTLMVAGSAAGMSATFSSPFAAILLAVELLLFEWRPRSLVPVAVASVVAALARVPLLGPGPIFPMTASLSQVGLITIGVGALCGIIVGLSAAALSRSLYQMEDWFAALPISTLWWPALGGLVVGLGGLLVPRALGVGYDNIADLLTGHVTLTFLIGLALVKSAIWVCSLGSGTSGGVLAPLLTIGGTIGFLACEILRLPPQTWVLGALLGMGSMLSGSLGAPLTAVVFGIEITGNFAAMLPLIVGCVAAHLITSLIMPRSILTERLSRRGYHLSREYGVDPMELVIVRDIMIPAPSREASYPVEPFAYSDETGRSAAEKLLLSDHKQLPVVDRQSKLLVGYLEAQQLLQGRRLQVSRERQRSRPLGFF